jgi:hypothetical protein
LRILLSSALCTPWSEPLVFTAQARVPGMREEVYDGGRRAHGHATARHVAFAERVHSGIAKALLDPKAAVASKRQCNNEESGAWQGAGWGSVRQLNQPQAAAGIWDTCPKVVRTEMPQRQGPQRSFRRQMITHRSIQRRGPSRDLAARNWYTCRGHFRGRAPKSMARSTPRIETHSKNPLGRTSSRTNLGRARDGTTLNRGDQRTTGGQ